MYADLLSMSAHRWWRLSFRRTVTNGTQPKAKHAVAGFVLLLFFFILLENNFGRANDDTTNRSSTLSAIQTSFNCLHFMTRQPRRHEAYLSLQQIKFRRILPFAVLFCRGKHFHIHGALHSPIEPETISIERCIHFIVFHLPLHNTHNTRP